MADAVDDDWKRTLKRRASKSRKDSEKYRTTPWGSEVRFRSTPEFLNLIRDEATRRGMTMGGYIRRSVAKQLAKDMGVPWETILALTPYPAKHDTLKPPKEYREQDNGKKGLRRALPDDGTGYGDWT